METVRIYESRRALLLRPLGGITLVAAGVLAISMGGIGYVLGAVGVVLVGAVSAYLIAELVYRRPSSQRPCRNRSRRSSTRFAGTIRTSRFIEIRPDQPGAGLDGMG